MKRTILSTVIAGALGTLAGPAGAAEFWLCAQETSMTMPDGAIVTMWGYVQDSDANLGNGCAGTATVPGPALSVPVGDTSLTIHLRNDIGAEAVSLVIPGLNGLGGGAPVSVGGRIHSFTNQAAANGGTADYTWTNVAPGTYLYHSGTHAQAQVQMGLYGAVTKNAAAGQAYATGPAGSPVTTFAQETTLLLSEVDPVQHAAIAAGTLGSTIEYKPKYFLVNGTAAIEPVTPTAIGAVNQPSLLRILNAGLKSHAMVLDDLRMTVVAEDGKLAPYPKDQASTLVAAQQTVDVLVTPTADKDYAFYDRIGTSSTNGVNRFGGLLAVLNPGTVVFSVLADSFGGNEDTAVTGSVVANDTSPAIPPQSWTVSQVSGPASGTLTLNPNGSFSYTPNLNFNGVDSFVYSATDGTNTAQATVTLNVAAVNDAPTITSAGPTTATEDAPYSYQVAAADVDAGDTQTYSLDPGFPAGMTISPTGLVSWTPTNAQVGPQSYTVRVTDAGGLFATQTVNVTVANVNDAPTLAAIATPQSAFVGTPFSVAALGSDIDAGDTLTYSMSGNPAWLGINPATGVLSGTPGAGDAGSSAITVTVTDVALATASQPFTLNVTVVNLPPTANAGPDQSVTLPATASLAGAVTDDNVTPLALPLWSVVSGPGTVTFADPNAASTTASFSAAGVYTLRLTANDGVNPAVSDDVVVTVNAAVVDLIFQDGFDTSGAFVPPWSFEQDPGGQNDNNVSAAATLNGAPNGMASLIDDNTSMYVRNDTPVNEPRYRARFWFDPNSIPMANGNAHMIMIARGGVTPANNVDVARVEFRRNTGVYQVRAASRNNTGGNNNTAWVTISDAPHSIEIDWKAATTNVATDGYIKLWVDNAVEATPTAQLTTVANGTLRIQELRLGPANGIDGGTRGTELFDGFVSRRLTFIGP